MHRKGTQRRKRVSRRVAVYGKLAVVNTAYSLRHAAALLIHKRGADAFSVQMILGHSTMQMTAHVNLTSEDESRGHSKAGVMSAL
jgi:integrase/recombinase XerD